jgi:hypothetical protein
MLYASFWVIPWCLNFMPYFKTLCLFHLHWWVGWGITQKKAYNNLNVILPSAECGWKYILRELKNIRQENLCCMFINLMSTRVPLLKYFSVRENTIFCKASEGTSNIPCDIGILIYEIIHLISFYPLKTHLSTYLNIKTTIKCHSRCGFI